MMMMLQYDHLPTEILGLVESFLPPSDCAHLSATSTSLHRRWTAMRWYRTFQLHYGWRDQARLQKRTEKLRHCRRVLTKLIRLQTEEQRRQHQLTFYWDASERNLLSDNEKTVASNASINAAFSKYNECYRYGWEFTFVGCCHDEDPLQFCSTCHPTSSKSCSESIGTCKPRRGALLDDDDKSVDGQGGIPHPPNHQSQSNCRGLVNEDQCASTTQFNVTALVPSVKRLYVDLWDTIELSLLGYYDAADDEEPQVIHDQYPVPAIMRILRTSFLPDLFEYLYFMVGLKPLAMKTASHLSASRRRRRRRMRRGGGVLGPMLSRRFFGGTQGLKSPQQHQQPQQQRHAKTAASTTISDLIMRPCFEYVWRGITAPGDNMMESSYSQVNGSTTDTTTFEEIISLSDAAATMSAWKLACFLQQRGVGCLRCEICDCIDLIGDEIDSCDSPPKLSGQVENESTDESDDELHDANARENRVQPEASGRSTLLEEFHKKIGGGGAWIAPCQCRDPVHRQCLERKLNLVTKYEPWERLQLRFGRLRTILTRAKEDQSSVTPLAPKVWISYDNTIPVGWGWRHPADNDNEDDDSVTAVDDMGRFRSPSATCDRCGERFVRTVRLPRSRWEVLTASLSDPISMMRAVSTFIHFVLACAFLAACEGMCSDASCSSHRILLSTPLGVLKWPTTGLNGLALAWWQLQQCCMLHIFFSRRFAAIVDRLWMGPISFFYFRLYFYFIVTSALLTASYIPMVSRAIRINFLESWIAPWILELLQPVGDAIALANLFQYAFVSTTVVCIFWRTNYRIFTVADGKEAAAILRRGEVAAPDLPGVNNPERIARLNGARHVADNADPDLHLRHRAWGAGGGVNAANHPMYHGPW